MFKSLLHFAFAAIIFILVMTFAQCRGMKAADTYTQIELDFNQAVTRYNKSKNAGTMTRGQALTFWRDIDKLSEKAKTELLNSYTVEAK